MWSVQHGSLRRAYEYFRERALEPSVVEDETIEYGPGEIPGIESWVSFKIGTIQMQQAIIDNMDY